MTQFCAGFWRSRMRKIGSRSGSAEFALRTVTRESAIAQRTVRTINKDGQQCVYPIKRGDCQDRYGARLLKLPDNKHRSGLKETVMKWISRCALSVALSAIAPALNLNASEWMNTRLVSGGNDAAQQESAVGSTCSSCESGCDGVYQDYVGGWFVIAETTFFRYHRTDGVRIGTDSPDEDVEFDFEASPRITLGYVNGDGLGARIRWWDYDHSAEAIEGDGSEMSVDTHTIDLEIFQEYYLSPRTTLIVSGGIRVNEFDEVMVDEVTDELRINSFDGYGGIMGLELWRQISCNGSLFAGVRGAVLMDDKFVFNSEAGVAGTDVLLRDSVQGMFELSLGYQYSVELSNDARFIARAAGEWQNWYNYSSSFNAADENEFDGASDVGFGGVVLGAGFIY